MSGGYLERITQDDKITFAREYASHGNAFQAVLRIGVPALAAEAVSTSLLMEPAVGKAIKLYTQWAESQRRATRKTIKNRAASILNTSMKDFYRTDPLTRQVAFVPPTEWTQEQATAVRKIKYSKKVNPFDGTEEHTYQLELADPLPAARMLLEFNLEDNDDGEGQASELEALKHVTDEELQYRIRDLLG